MKTPRTLAAAAVAAVALLSGCASSPMNNNGYNSGYNNAASMGYGTIESIQVTQADAGRTSGAGAIAGALVGALAGNQVGSGSGRTAATVAGGVGGALVGNNLEKNRSAGAGQEMYQLNVRMDNGEYRTVVQDSVHDLRVGNRVRLVDGRVYRY